MTPGFNDVSEAAKISSCCSRTRVVISSNLCSTFKLPTLMWPTFGVKLRGGSGLTSILLESKINRT